MRHSLMTFEGNRRRKKRKVLSQSSDDDGGVDLIDVDLDSSDSSKSPLQSSRSFQHEVGELPNAIHARDMTWVQRYADVESQTGLVVSPKKKNEVIDWLRKALEFSGSRLLMLGGPPGCGKSSVVQAVCKELHCDIATWQAPFVESRGVSNALLEDFRGFFVGSRYPALQLEDEDEGEEPSSPSRRVLLVEDLPIHVTDVEQNKEVLRKVFSDAAQFAPHPTIVIMSDGEKGIARLARLLLGLDLLSSSIVETIKIPAVTDAMMKRRLREVLASEGLSISPQRLDLVVATSRGDMRAALNCLQLSSNAGSGENLDGILTNSRKRQRPKQRNSISPLAAISHDLTLSTYHAVSKILNNKRQQDGVSKYVAEQVLDEARTDPEAFLSFLHQNYLEFYGSADDVVPTLLCLSEADTFMPWIQEGDLRTDLSDCAASVATRAFLHFNSSPIRFGWRPIRGPESHEVAREGRMHVQHVRETLSKVLRPRVLTRSDACETVAYAKRIKQCTIKHRGLSKSNKLTSASSLANAADIAMVDLESTVPEQTVVLKENFANGISEILDSGSTEEDQEDIEEWED